MAWFPFRNREGESGLFKDGQPLAKVVPISPLLGALVAQTLMAQGFHRRAPSRRGGVAPPRFRAVEPRSRAGWNNEGIFSPGRASFSASRILVANRAEVHPKGKPIAASLPAAAVGFRLTQAPTLPHRRRPAAVAGRSSFPRITAANGPPFRVVR